MSHYYDDHDLSRFGDMGRNAPDLWEKFNDWYQATFQEGSLSGREKALIALGVAHALQCPYCIDAWSQECLEKGSNLDQMTEGGPRRRRHPGRGPRSSTASRCGNGTPS